MESNFLDPKDIALIGRQKNVVSLNYDKSIMITTDILKWATGSSSYPPSIYLNDSLNTTNVFSEDIILDTGSGPDFQSMVNGEKLVELLSWLIDTLMTHKNPPNACPIPDFFPEAIRRKLSMEDEILNKRVKSR